MLDGCARAEAKRCGGAVDARLRADRGDGREMTRRDHAPPRPVVDRVVREAEPGGRERGAAEVANEGARWGAHGASICHSDMARKIGNSALGKPALWCHFAAMTEDDMDPVGVGKRLAAARVALGYPTQAGICHVLGVDQGNWSRYEKGTRMIPPHIVARMLLRWGVTWDYIYGGRESGLPADFCDLLRKGRRGS